jgi:hypothetical protein
MFEGDDSFEDFGGIKIVKKQESRARLKTAPSSLILAFYLNK